MQKPSKMKRIVKLSFLFGLIGVLSPWILGTLNFYAPLHAEPVAAITQTTAAPSSIGTTGPVSYADAVAKAAPAVVSIHTTKEVPAEMNPFLQDPFFRYFFGEPGDPDSESVPKELQQGLGSGVIVNAKGYVLTNNHVIKDATTVMVTLSDGRSAEAKVVGTDPDTDLAVLKLNLEKLPVILIGSSHQLRVGDVVLAIGNPFNIGQTVTQGIISATERSDTSISALENFLQTDAAINPGNSGGALIDAYGNLIGINTAIYSRSGGYQGIGFAIPIDQAKDIMQQLINNGHIVRGFLGVTLQPLNKEIRDYLEYKGEEGVYIRAVVRGSPAQKAGLLPGDIIIRMNNQPIKDIRVALKLVANLAPNKAYPIEIFRKGDYMTFSVVVGEKKPQPAAPTKSHPSAKKKRQ